MSVIYINGKFLAQRITGVQRYSRDLISALGAQWKPGLPRFIIIVPAGKWDRSFKPENIEFKEVRSFGGLFLWEQLVLPLISFSKTLFCPCNVAPVLSLFFRRKTIVTVHDIAVFSIPDSFSFLFKCWYRFIIPLVLRRATRVVTISEFQKSEITRLFPQSADRVITILNGVTPFKSPREKKVSSKSDYVLFVGSLSPRKNLMGLIEAMKLVRHKYPLRLMVIGGSSSHFAKSDIVFESWIDWRHSPSDEELVSAYAHASVFVFPSFYEGFGLPPLEAMSLGCPVAVSRVSSMPEVCGDAALYFDPSSSLEIAQSIEKVVTNHEVRSFLISQGRKRVLEFSWENSAGEYLSRAFS